MNSIARINQFNQQSPRSFRSDTNIATVDTNNSSITTSRALIGGISLLGVVGSVLVYRKRATLFKQKKVPSSVESNVQSKEQAYIKPPKLQKKDHYDIAPITNDEGRLVNYNYVADSTRPPSQSKLLPGKEWGINAEEQWVQMNKTATPLAKRKYYKVVGIADKHGVIQYKYVANPTKPPADIPNHEWTIKNDKWIAIRKQLQPPTLASKPHYIIQPIFSHVGRIVVGHKYIANPAMPPPARANHEWVVQKGLWKSIPTLTNKPFYRIKPVTHRISGDILRYKHVADPLNPPPRVAGYKWKISLKGEWYQQKQWF